MKTLLALFTAAFLVNTTALAQESAAAAPAAPAPNYNRAKEAEALHFGLNAIIWGTPLVNMERLQRNSVNGLAGKNNDVKVPPIALNKFVFRNVDKSGVEHVPAANNDSLGAMTFMDFRKEPMVLEVPKMEKGQNYFFQITNAFQTSYNYIGHRTHGYAGAKYVFVGPDWKGKLPKGLIPIHSPDNMNAMLVFFTVSSESELKEATQLRSEIKLYPLSHYGTGNTNPEPNWLVSKERVALDLNPDIPKELNFFQELATALKYTKPPASDALITDNLKRIGFTKDFRFDYQSLRPEQVNGLKKAVELSNLMIDGEAMSVGRRINNWTYVDNAGRFGTDYLFRAAASKWYTFPHHQEVISYLAGRLDENGERLNGANNYVVRFEKGQLPRTKGIWSLTLYDKQGYFVKNPANRFSYQNKTGDLIFNDDGSLEIYLQNTDPGPGKNWLPAPLAEFYVFMKLYETDDALATGQWKPPLIKKL